MKKWIRNTITLLGVISALIAIRSVFVKPMHIDLEIEVRSPVFWEDEPVSVSAETDVWTADMMDYKVVVFQRNTKDPSGTEIFQFEKLLTKRSDTLNGNIWFGSQEIGNNESYIITAVVVKKSEKFKKHPFTYSMETIPFKAIAQKTVVRNDAVGIEGNVSLDGMQSEKPVSSVSESAPVVSDENESVPESAKSQKASSEPLLTQLSPSGLKQLKDALLRKESRPAHLQKIDSVLLGLIPQGDSLDINSGQSIAKLDLIIKAQVNEDLLQEMERLGGCIRSVFQEHDWIRAEFSPSALETLAYMDSVQFIRRYEPPVVNKMNVSEGDVAHRANIARAGFNVSGEGVKIGVLSDSASSSQLNTLIAKGDLPAGRVTVLPGQAGDGSDEGLAMLEIVHDLAPDAELYFATASGGAPVFAQNIRKLRDAGCDVIVDDVAYFAEPAFEDGIIADAVEDVVADGVVYLSSAGNSGNQHDGQSGVWEGDFSLYRTIEGTEYETHNFGSGELIRITSGINNVILLKWSDKQQASGNDYDLYLVDSSGNIVGSSANLQNGNDDPLEGFAYNVNYEGYYLLVVRKSGSGTRFLHLNTNRGRLAGGTAGQIYGQSAAAGCIAVAAVDANSARGSGGVFDGRESVEYFSSDGPRRIFYHADGSSVTPGNYTSSGGTVRNKPDFAAADRVKCATDGFNPFPGTSAAAPHAAAIVALMLDKNPGLSVSEVRQALVAGSLDIEDAGWDRDSGYGLIDAYRVLQNTPSAGLSAPLGVSASKGLYLDDVRISWGSVSEASHYKVYRASSAAGAKIAVSGWQTGTSFDDTTAAEGVVYWYCVRAAENSAGANASAYSVMDTGYLKELTQLAAPAGVNASDGTLESMVSISWNAVNKATHYRVYRATSIGGSKTTLGSWQTSRTYYDTSAETGTTYYYWIKSATSVNGANASEYSTHNSGHRLVESITTGALSNVYWSEELDEDGDGYTHQRKLRFSTTLSGSANIRFKLSYKTGSVWTTYFENSGTLAGEAGLQNWGLASVGSAGLAHGSYDWKIEMYEDSRLLDAESADSDLIDQKFETMAEDLPNLPSPTGVGATDGVFGYKVVVSWNAVGEATHYQVYRATSENGEKTAINDWQKSTYFNDVEATPGVNYHYWIKSSASDTGSRMSEYSQCVTGYMNSSGVLTPHILRRFGGRMGYEMDVSKDGRFLVSNGGGCASLLELPTAKMLMRFDHPSPCSSVAIAPDGKTVATGHGDGGVRQWDLYSGEMIREYDMHGSSVTAIAFSSNSERIASVGYDRNLCVWDVTSGGRLFSVRASDSSSSYTVAFSPDGSTVATGDNDALIKLWNADNGSWIRNFTGHKNRVSSIDFSPDGLQILSGAWQMTGDYPVRLWDVNSGTCVRTFGVAGGSPVYSVAFFPDGGYLVSGGEDGVHVWNPNTGSLVRSLVGHSSSVYNVACTPDGTILGIDYDLHMLRWSAHNGTLQSHYDFGPSGMVSGFSPDGESFVTTRWGNLSIVENKAKLWNVWDEELSDTFAPYLGHLNQSALSKSGTVLAAGYRDGNVKLWSVMSGSLIRSFSAHTSSIYSIALSSDSSKLVTGGSDSKVKVWNATNGSLVRTHSMNAQIEAVAISPDDSYVVAGWDVVRMWSLSTGALVRSFYGHAPGVKAIKFTPDGSKLLTSGYDGTVRLWNVATGTQIRSFSGHSGSVYSVDVSPDGLLIATAGQDGTTKVWDIESGIMIYDMESGSGCAVFSPDGNYLLTSGSSASSYAPPLLWGFVSEGDFRELSVNDATGSGEYIKDEFVTVWANAAPTGRVFSHWEGATQYLDDTSNYVTRVRMPDQSIGITAIYLPAKHELTVTGGAESGQYSVGHVVPIVASAPPSGQVFNVWTGDTDCVLDISATNTTLIMPDHDVSITATYHAPNYTLTVNNGSGGGSYTLGKTVSLVADASPSGERFDAWSGDTNSLADASSASTSVIMPAHDVSVTATYTGYRLTVDQGSGSGVYPSDRTVLIDAETAPSGQIFERWVGDVDFVDALSNATANVTMPRSNITLQATYTSVADDPFGFPETYPTVGMNILGRVELFGESASSGDIIAVFSGTELRGKAEVIVEDTFTGVNLGVQVAQNGELLTFKLWDSSESVVYDVSPDCNINAVSGTTQGSYPDDLVPIIVSDDIALNMDLSVGWNQVSFNLDFDDPTIRSVLSNVLDSVSFVKGDGGSFDPALPDAWNTLLEFIPVNGFWLQMDSDQLLTLSGPPVRRTAATIQLAEGWNHVGYPLAGAAGIRVVLADALASNVIDQITDSTGVFNPDVPDMVNSLTHMRPGRGYWVKANQAYTLVFNENESPFLNGMSSVSSMVNNGTQSVHPFGDSVVYPNPVMSVFADVKLHGVNASYGDVVAAYVGNELRGIQHVDIMFDQTALVALAINVESEGEDIRFKVWDASAEQVLTVPDVVVSTTVGGSPYSYPDHLLVLDAPTGVDADGDGLPDAWEDSHGGNLNPTALCSNGVNTVREAYIAGLDPTNATSRLILNPVSGNALHWSAISGRVYSIWWTTNLLENFQPLETNLFWPQGGYTNPNPSPSDFYKIKVELE